MRERLSKALLRFTEPLRIASRRDITRRVLITLICGLCAASAFYAFADRYRIAWDRQVVKCMDSSFLLVDLKDRTLERDKAYAFHSQRAEPVVKDGTLVGKYLRGMPGDLVEILPDERVLVNGRQIAQGMPHLRGLSKEEARRFYGSRRLGEDEYWMMGTKYLSYDSRYWGPVRSSQIIGRSYELF